MKLNEILLYRVGLGWNDLAVDNDHLRAFINMIIIMYKCFLLRYTFKCITLYKFFLLG